MLIPRAIWSQHTILTVKHTKLTQFYPKPYQIKMQTCLAKRMENLVGRGLDREGANLKLWIRGRALSLERGLNRTAILYHPRFEF